MDTHYTHITHGLFLDNHPYLPPRGLSCYFLLAAAARVTSHSPPASCLLPTLHVNVASCPPTWLAIPIPSLCRKTSYHVFIHFIPCQPRGERLSLLRKNSVHANTAAVNYLMMMVVMVVWSGLVSPPLPPPIPTPTLGNLTQPLRAYVRGHAERAACMRVCVCVHVFFCTYVVCFSPSSPPPSSIITTTYQPSLSSCRSAISFYPPPLPSMYSTPQHLSCTEERGIERERGAYYT
ncbi:hypothetical protein F5X96DRAFT_162301 [Biscogniauxia mediterranea]|nr:hypothetical protein F5X96DRAFT_162301 [Biscogniauxia mediterranea]